jgi:hypothetical protein
MKPLIVLLLSCTSLFAGENLVPLKSGETNIISYGLFCLVSDSRSASNAPAGEDLVLVLRNNGAKWIGMSDITREDFKLRDAKGNQVKIYLRTSPKNIPYGGADTIQLIVNRADAAPEPWTLHFSNRDPFVPIDLTITDIKPRKN